MILANFRYIQKACWSLPSEIKMILDFGFETALTAYTILQELPEVVIWGFTEHPLSKALLLYPIYERSWEGAPEEFRTTKKFDLIIWHAGYETYYHGYKNTVPEYIEVPPAPYNLIEQEDGWLLLYPEETS